MTASADPVGSSLRFGIRLAGLIGLFFAYVPPHLLSKWLLGRSSWPPRFLRHAGLVVGVRPKIKGRILGPHSLIIANHTSWLDILLLGGWCGAAFISKSELKSTPLLGWIAEQNRTLYIDRTARWDSHDQVRQVRAALEHRQPLAVFPEGTTGDGRHLMDFRPTLLEAVAPPPPGVTVRPVAIDYGENARVVGWHGGESGLKNFQRVLGNAGSMAVTIRLLEALPATHDRKAMARNARRSIASALSSLVAPDTL